MSRAKVFKAHSVPQGLCANLVNALKLLANQQEDGDGLSQNIAKDLGKESRRGLTDGLREFIKVDNERALDVGALRRGMGTIEVRKPKAPEGGADVIVRESPDELTLRAEDVNTSNALINVDHIELERWGPPPADADGYAFCKGIEGEDWEEVCDSFRSHFGSRAISVQVNIVAVSDRVFHRLPFDLRQLSLFSCIPFVLMATGRASEDAMRTSLPGSPPLSSNVGSPHGSGHDLDGMGTRSGNILDEKLDALLSKFVHFETQIAQIPALTTWMSRVDSHILKTLGDVATCRDGTEIQCPHLTYVEVRDICCLSIKYFRFSKILAYTRTS